MPAGTPRATDRRNHMSGEAPEKETAMTTDPNLLLLERIRWGMNVCDSEHQPIGRVVKVYRAATYGAPPPAASPTEIEPYLEVERAGSGTRLFVPIGSLSDVTGDCVVLNITWDQVDRMGWEQRPDYLQDPPGEG